MLLDRIGRHVSTRPAWLKVTSTSTPPLPALRAWRPADIPARLVAQRTWTAALPPAAYRTGRMSRPCPETESRCWYKTRAILPVPGRFGTAPSGDRSQRCSRDTAGGFSQTARLPGHVRRRPGAHCPARAALARCNALPCLTDPPSVPAQARRLNLRNPPETGAGPRRYPPVQAAPPRLHHTGCP